MTSTQNINYFTKFIEKNKKIQKLFPLNIFYLIYFMFYTGLVFTPSPQRRSKGGGARAIMGPPPKDFEEKMKGTG